MSVQSEITRLTTAKSDIATAITNKGVTVPSGTKLDGMAALIGNIESGGSGGALSVETGTLTSTKKMSAPGAYDYTFDISPRSNINDRLAIILVHPNSYGSGNSNAYKASLLSLVRLNKSDYFHSYAGSGLIQCASIYVSTSSIKLYEAVINNPSLETPSYIAI